MWARKAGCRASGDSSGRKLPVYLAGWPSRRSHLTRPLSEPAVRPEIGISWVEQEHPLSCPEIGRGWAQPLSTWPPRRESWGHLHLTLSSPRIQAITFSSPSKFDHHPCLPCGSCPQLLGTKLWDYAEFRREGTIPHPPPDAQKGVSEP